MTTLLNGFASRLRPLLAAAAFGLAIAAAPTPTFAQQGAHEAPAGTVEHAAEQAHDDHGAAGHGEKAGVLPTVEQGIVPSIVALVVFGLVFAILATQVWPKINAGLEDRSRKIREEIAAAEAARKQAKDALEQYERSLADARAEAQAMLEQTKQQQQALAAELKAQADAELGQLRERARRDIEAAKRAALSEIQSKAVDLGIIAAGKVLQRQLTPQDQQRILEESLGELQSLAAR